MKHIENPDKLRQIAILNNAKKKYPKETWKIRAKIFEINLKYPRPKLRRKQTI